MAMYRTPAVALLLSLSTLAAASSNAFLAAAHGGQSVVTLQVRSEELQEALGAVLGCTGGGVDDDQRLEKTSAIRTGLLPMWRSLPKNQGGLVEWRLLRYVTHRHFMQRFNVLVRGLEPTIRLNATTAGEADILSQQAPALAQQLTGTEVKHGFSLEDAVVMIAALEQLLFDSDRALLEKMYQTMRLAVNSLVDTKSLQAMLKDYMVYWMMGDDQESAALLVKDANLLVENIPHWAAIVAMVEGSVKALEFSKQRWLEPGSAHIAFDGHYTFEDALEVVGSISRSFGGFWESQCQETKTSLLALDSAGTGRVRLPDFYGANKEGEWRFGESEAYLRDLGALDETSAWRGKQVIVSNYVQAVSNCVVTRPHYLVCCRMECEGILGQIEAATGAPLATAEQILEVVASIIDMDDEHRSLDARLQAQLHRVAQTHRGSVPLHGRLFAQWLHYAFPRECPFPHKAGDTVSLTPTQFGEDSVVLPDEVNKRVADDVVQQDLLGGNVTDQRDQWMTQWSEDEELLADYSLRQDLPSTWNRAFALGVAATLVGSLLLSGAGKHDQAPRTHSV